MLEEVARIVAQAGRIAAARSGGDFERWEKQPGQPVCDIDLEVNSYLHDQLQALDPQAGWFSEETVDSELFAAICCS